MLLRKLPRGVLRTKGGGGKREKLQNVPYLTGKKTKRNQDPIRRDWNWEEEEEKKTLGRIFLKPAPKTYRPPVFLADRKMKKKEKEKKKKSIWQSEVIARLRPQNPYNHNFHTWLFGGKGKKKGRKGGKKVAIARFLNEPGVVKNQNDFPPGQNTGKTDNLPLKSRGSNGNSALRRGGECGGHVRLISREGGRGKGKKKGGGPTMARVVFSERYYKKKRGKENKLWADTKGSATEKKKKKGKNKCASRSVD